MKILYGDAPITMLDSVFITIVSMSIVFFVLILISSILSLFKYISSEEGTAKSLSGMWNGKAVSRRQKRAEKE